MEHTTQQRPLPVYLRHCQGPPLPERLHGWDLFLILLLLRWLGLRLRVT